MRLIVPLLLLLSTACGGQGAAVPRSFQPSDVRELGALPPGYSSGATLRASCSSLQAQAFDDEALGNVDCNVQRLSRVLRARAGELSVRFIVGKHCHARGAKRAELSCSAKLAYPGERVGLEAGFAADAGPAPSPDQVADLDEPRPQDAAQIRVSFRPSEPRRAAGLAPRNYDRVAETSLASVGREVLGQVSARCDGCDPNRLRHALRVTAGRVGAGEVTQVRCFQDDGAARCIATALVPWSS